MTGRKLVDHLVTKVSLEGEGKVVASHGKINASQKQVAKGNEDIARAALKTIAAERKRAAAFKTSSSALREMSQGASSLVRIALKLERRLDQVESTTRKASKELRGMRRVMRGIGRNLSVASGKWTEFNSKLEVGKKAISGLTTAFTKLVASPALLAVDFETGLARIRTLGRDTAGELEEGLAKLAKRVPQDIVDITRGAYSAISAQAFRSNKEILKLLDSASRVATGAGTTLEKAVDGLTAATNSYASSNLSAERAADIMFTTLRVGKIKTLDELIDSMGKSLSTAAITATNFEQVGASVATMTARGVSAAEGLVRFEQVLKNFAKPTRQQRKAMDELGISYGIVDLKAKGLTGKLKEIVKVTGASAEALAKISGRNTESFQGLSLLLGDDGGELFLRNLGEIRNGVGDADRAFKQLDNTTAGAFARLKSEFEATLVEIGKRLLPVVNRGIAILREYIKGLSREDVSAIAEQLRRVGATVVDVGASLLRTLRSAAPMLERMVSMIVGFGQGVGFLFRLTARETERMEAALERAGAGFDRLTNSIRREKMGHIVEATEMLEEAMGEVTGVLNSQHSAFSRYFDVIDEAITVSDRLAESKRHASIEGGHLVASMGALASHMPGVAIAAGAVATELGGIAISSRASIAAVDELTLAMGRSLTVMTAFPGAAVAMQVAVRQALNAARRSRSARPARVPPRQQPPARTRIPRRRGGRGEGRKQESGPLSFGFLDPAVERVDAIGRAVQSTAERGTAALQALAAEAKASMDSIGTQATSFGSSVFTAFNQAAVGAILYEGSVAGLGKVVLRTLAEQGIGLGITNTGWALFNEGRFASTGFPGYRIAANKHWTAAATFGGIGALSAIIGSAAGAFDRSGGGAGGGGGSSASISGAFSNSPARDFGQRDVRPRKESLTVVYDFSGAARGSTGRLWQRAVVGSLNGSVRRRGAQRVDSRVIGGR